MKTKILVVDGNSLIFRAFYATAYSPNTSLLKTKSGVLTNAVYSFINMLLSVIHQRGPYDHILIAFDKGKKTFRHDLLSDYKANRIKTPNELVEQFSIVREFLTKANIQWFEQENIEADDIVGSICKYAEKQFDDLQAEILSSDKDMYQLITNKAICLNPVQGVNELEEVDTNKLFEKWQISPNQVPDYKAIVGDSSDNLKGVNGIGQKGAIKLIQQYESLENIYNNLEQLKGAIKTKLEQDKKMAFLCKDLATIKTDVTLENFSFKKLDFNVDNIYEFLNKYEMYSLKKRFTNILNLDFNPYQNKKQNLDVKIINSWSKDYEDSINYLYVESLEEDYHKDKIIGIGISNNKGNFYLDFKNKAQQLSFFEDTTLSSTDSLFEEFLNNPNLKKYTYDIKKTTYLLKNHKYNVLASNFDFDFMVACYSLNANVVSDLSNQIKLVDNLIELETIDQIFGKGVKKNPDIDLYIKSKYISKKAHLLKKYSDQLIEQLKQTNTYYLYLKIDHPLIEVLYDIEVQGILIDKEQLKLQTQQILKKINHIEWQMKILVAEEIDNNFNFSSPKQIQELLFDKLKLPNLEKGTTSKEVLEKLITYHPIINLLLEHRKYTKLYTTYLKGFEKFIFDDNKVHTIFNHTLTNTGRLSSSYPNIQNISIRDNEQKEVRKIFITNNNKTFLSYDYSQIELRVLAQMSKERNLINAFNQNADIHLQAAKLIFNLSDDQITSEQRRIAKVFNFGILYGLTDFGLASDLNMNVNQAKQMIKDYYSAFPSLLDFKEKQVEIATNQGYITTLSNRRRYINELNSTNHNIRQFGKRIAVNTPIQGTASDILKVAMISIYKKLKEQNLDAKIICQIHDEIILEVDDNQLEQTKKIVVSELENALEKLFLDLNIKEQVVVKLKVGESVGKTWFDLK
ncbi:DNA polymerase I [Mycoplasma capricolum]|uniref:DNA polymerase I n=1 Tax=Mycoplasma capricolum TaxID=2095 RepID=UPI0004F8E607|nr:DNA polymerase I [Mycoplasma capricolum]QDL19767.1 DNA polymerase I [Mycoplasma capricolum subsp. capripneumoniae]QDL20452.1 DNA polymerase I [Mycoplasma capricolum subsp. capripneumoniae]QDL21140.1 DNA polymerase I [Mycoplasma capricolum subsp. capripneumoniae]CEA11106.1 DNA polymerase I [Mycoplasma capricolum subsp. capripneumoniae]